MSISRKYGRTYHFPFSPGTTSDDRIHHNYWEHLSAIDTIINTEKLDGENNCLSKHGVFARSHAAPTTSAWTRSITQKWQLLKNDLGNYEIFGENLFAIHSIKYTEIEDHFYVFGVRELDKWLSWEETAFVAAAFDLPLVPVIGNPIQPKNIQQNQFEADLLNLVTAPSIFGSTDVATQAACSLEGIVTRNIGEYDVTDFANNVFKYVRKGHVKTDEHWTRHWKRAPLKFEQSCG